jgi:hypothetical protein
LASSTYIRIRQRYQLKRSGIRYHTLRRKRIFNWQRGETYFLSNKRPSYDTINLPAPDNFSFINNTDELLKYIRIGRQILKNGQSIRFDISDINRLTSDSIPLLLSHAANPKYSRSIPIHGNAPKIEMFNKIFTESGLYKYVKSEKKFETNELNIMHNESNHKVKPELAGSAVELILSVGNFAESYIEPIYNIFIELMSNTHSHANLKIQGASKWWMFVYTDKVAKTIEISFVDLGVGIFKSLIVRSFIQKIGLKVKLINNSILVRDLLSGKIQSRIDYDNEIRGKGIPQILEYAKFDCFNKFYLITNDIKIDLKSHKFNKLNESLNGTFYYLQLNY